MRCSVACHGFQQHLVEVCCLHKVLRCVNWTLSLSWFKQSRCFPAVSGPWAIIRMGHVCWAPASIPPPSTLFKVPFSSPLHSKPMWGHSGRRCPDAMFSPQRTSIMALTSVLFLVSANLVCHHRLLHWVELEGGHTDQVRCSEWAELERNTKKE